MFEALIDMDITLLNYVRSFVNPDSPLQVSLIRMGSDIEVLMIMTLLVVLWLYGVYKKDNEPRIDALMILYSIGFAFFIYVILNLGLPLRPRPESVSAIRPLVDHLPDNSFPSGHGIFAGASVLAAFLYTRHDIAWVLLFAGVFMVSSRVLAGIHYPLDIFVGVIIGMVGTYVVYKLRNHRLMRQYLLVCPVKIAAFFRL